MKKKDEAFDKFVVWKMIVENQSEKKVKKLITDNGLEYCNHYFDKFCRDEGIVRHRTCTYTPQQNGIAERLNHTIMDKVRSILSESGLDQTFWAEAASTAVYLINKSPSTAIEFDLPEEKWTSALPDLSGLKKFGCLAYVHTDQGKLNPRARKGVFTGYPEGVKGYKVWLLEEEKCVISRNVVFREEVMFKDLKKEHQKGIYDFSLEEIPKSPTESDQGGVSQEQIPSTGVLTEIQNLSNVQDDESELDSDEDGEDLSDYQLVRDRAKRIVKIMNRIWLVIHIWLKMVTNLNRGLIKKPC